MGTAFIKTIFKYSKKVKRIRNYVLKCNLYLHFMMQPRVADFWWKNGNISRTQDICHMIYIFFGSSQGKV